MRLLILNIMLLFSIHTYAKINVFDPNNILTSIEREKLIYKVTNSLNYFNTFKKFKGEINIDINPSSCLRTSYNYIDKRIAFCKTKNTIFMGLNSVDIINHEIFHYLYCHSYPKNCSPEVMKSEFIQSFHEGLADFFAYQMNTDSFFGENFRVDIPYLRKYKTPLCYKYTYSSHQKGNALSSIFINNNYTFSSLEKFMASMDFKDLPSDSCLSSKIFQLEPKNRSVSKKNKYWIKLNEVIEFSYKLENGYSLRHPVESDLFEFKASNRELQITSQGKKGFKKIILHITQEEKIVGETRLYLGVR